ncbi:MAG: glycosyltransferase family 4 protein [Verrucomicrobiota bacterium]|nr:glycosyltransferase family 4 protein [Verrucomicrobiota bacterium]
MMPSTLYSAPPVGKQLTGSPVSAFEHLLVMKPAFSHLCYVLGGHTPMEERAEREGVSVWCEPMVSRGLRHAGPVRFFKGIGPVLSSRWRYLKRLSRLLKTNPGILHVHSLAFHLPYALLAAKLAGVPSVVTIREPWRGNWEVYWYLLWVRLLASRVVCLSQAMVEQYPKWIGKTTIIHNSFVLPPERLPPTNERPLVAMIGNMGFRKGTDLFLEACRIWHEHGIPFDAWLVGGWETPTAQQQAQAFIREHHLENQICIKGEWKNIRDIYPHVDVLVQPSRKDPFPRVVMEAMGYGIAVVSTRVDGIPSMVEPSVTGFLVEPGHADALAAAVERLLRDGALRETMGKAGRLRAAELFSPETYFRKMKALYEEVTGGGSMAPPAVSEGHNGTMEEA